ncbi:hypothetical protein [Hyphomicrobium sp.]|uniref:hypothetical protein n=1 Tax=Hyphomicrobium sp. TaxID=82 RepID=UPI000FBE2D00|nr:hypothetical protein [Hyphomicrobium sp.]RUO98585.1 MAG: hypothetical protein EKK30_10175 [Hyphomicrobium sp.]
MLNRLAIALLIPALAGWSDDPPPWPYSGPMPDRPVRTDNGQGYAPVNAGAKAFQPVDPAPWGDVNRRVAPAPSNGKDVPEHDMH